MPQPPQRAKVLSAAEIAARRAEVPKFYLQPKSLQDAQNKRYDVLPTDVG